MYEYEDACFFCLYQMLWVAKIHCHVVHGYPDLDNVAVGEVEMEGVHRSLDLPSGVDMLHANAASSKVANQLTQPFR